MVWACQSPDWKMDQIPSFTMLCVHCSVVWLCPPSPLLPVLPLLLAGLPSPAGPVCWSCWLAGSSGPGRRLHRPGQRHPAGQRHLHVLRQEPPRRARLAHVSHRAHRLTQRWGSFTGVAMAQSYTKNQDLVEFNRLQSARTQPTLGYHETFYGNIFVVLQKMKCLEKCIDLFMFGFVSKKK